MTGKRLAEIERTSRKESAPAAAGGDNGTRLLCRAFLFTVT